MKKLIAGLFLAIGLSGFAAAVMPTPASALPLCVRVNVTVFGTRLGPSGSNFTCVP